MLKKGLFVLLVSLLAVSAFSWRLSKRGEYSISFTTDTTGLDTIVGEFGISETYDDYNSLIGWAIVAAPYPNLHGYGLADSATVRLATTNDIVTDVLAADSGAIPCTLYFSLPNTGDTLFKREFKFQYEVWDTVTDTVFSGTHAFKYEVEAR